MSFKRLAPLLVLLALVAAAFVFRFDKYLTLDALRDNRAALAAFVQSHGVGAALGFVLAYAAVVALSLPGVTIMTLTGGFLFGVSLGAAVTVIGATAGASLLFLIARSAFGDALRERACPSSNSSHCPSIRSPPLLLEAEADLWPHSRSWPALGPLALGICGGGVEMSKVPPARGFYSLFEVEQVQI